LMRGLVELEWRSSRLTSKWGVWITWPARVTLPSLMSRSACRLDKGILVASQLKSLDRRMVLLLAVVLFGMSSFVDAFEKQRREIRFGTERNG